jgi:hypothetical protein
MSRYFGWLFTMLVMLATSAPLQALNYEVRGCKTGSGYVTFTTISAAVAGVPAGSKIFYAAGTSGTINEVTTRNHQSSGCGNSIWAENTAGAMQIIRIENSPNRGA